MTPEISPSSARHGDIVWITADIAAPRFYSARCMYNLCYGTAESALTAERELRKMRGLPPLETQLAVAYTVVSRGRTEQGAFICVYPDWAKTVRRTQQVDLLDVQVDDEVWISDFASCAAAKGYPTTPQALFSGLYHSAEDVFIGFREQAEEAGMLNYNPAGLIAVKYTVIDKGVHAGRLFVWIRTDWSASNVVTCPSTET